MVSLVVGVKPNATLSERELIDYVAARIPRYKKPRYVSFVDALPKKENALIDRAKVKAMYG